MFTPKNTSGFTIIEMVVAMTIFAFMSVTITTIYIQTTYIGEKMRHTRYLSETAREITERIADDVRSLGINENLSIPASAYLPWTNVDHYYQSGAELLGIGDGSKKYIYGAKTTTGIKPCTDHFGGSTEATKSDPQIHCWLYVVTWVDYIWGFNIVDSFVPEEEKKRVKVEDMRFYLSGDGIHAEKKVTLVFTLALMPRIGVPPTMVSETRLHIQTTISERFFKK